MKIAKQIRGQAKIAKRAAAQARDSVVAEELSALAHAFQAQADILKRNKDAAERKKQDARQRKKKIG
jgi:hypothetical protein